MREAEETGDHVMFHCKRWETDRRGWRGWDDVDAKGKEWLKPHCDNQGKVEWVESLLETFCTRVS